MEIAQRRLRFRQALLGGFFVPLERLFDILVDAIALKQHHRQIVLGNALALLGCPPIPNRPLGEIARHALAGAIHGSELKLGAGMTCLGSAAKPLSSLVFVALSPGAAKTIA